jgi:tetratricopeptide (TPR) repeat protein
VREYPNEKLAHHRLAGSYRSEGRVYQAIEEYNKVISLDPSFGWAINELGYMHADAGDFERAAECFQRYASAFPHDANPVDSMGELLFRMGRLDEAIERYKRALELKPDFYYAYWEIAYVSALREDYAEAVRWIGAFIREAPSFGTRIEGHRWMCLYLYWLGRYEAALAESRRMGELARAAKSTDSVRSWRSGL